MASPGSAPRAPAHSSLRTAPGWCTATRAESILVRADGALAGQWPDSSPAGGTPPGGHPEPTGAIPPRPSNTKRWLASAAAVLATVGVVSGAVTVARPVVTVEGIAVAPVGTKLPPPSLLGEVKTADPCSLLDPAALGGIGRAQVLSGFGDASACSVGVNRPTDYGWVTATTAAKTRTPPVGVRSAAGDLTIHRTAEYARTCDRTIVLPDGYRIEIFAGTGKRTPPSRSARWPTPPPTTSCRSSTPARWGTGTRTCRATRCCRCGRAT